LKNANSDRDKAIWITKLVAGNHTGLATQAKLFHFLLDADACFIDAICAILNRLVLGMVVEVHVLLSAHFENRTNRRPGSGFFPGFLLRRILPCIPEVHLS